MEINQQIFRAPSIPKIGKRTISSSVIRGAVKPQIKLNKSVFSFVKPVQKTVDTDKISVDSKGSLSVSAEKQLAETNRILVEIQKQLALDFGYRIAEEKKALAAEKKRISAQKVADKESNLEKDSRGILGKTFDKVVAPFKSIFQKLIDFFSIILTGILLNTALKWLSNPDNRKKLAEFFGFLKEYWQELLIVFGIAKLAKLVAKIFSIASKIKKLLSLWPKKPPMGGKDPCKCPKPGAPDFCKGILDCFDKVKSGSKIAENLATAIIGTTVFSNYMGRFGKQSQQPAPVLDTTKGSNIDQIYEEWNRRYQPATQTPRSQNGGLPPRLKKYIDNLQNQPTAEEKLFKQLGLPTWLTPVAEALITSILMSRGRGIPRLGTRSPRSTLDLGSTTSYQPPKIDYGPKITVEKMEVPTTLRAPNIRVTGTGGRKTTTRGTTNEQLVRRTSSSKLGELTQIQKKLLNEYDRSQIADIASGKIKTDAQTVREASDLIDKLLNRALLKKSKGGTIDGFSGGGTVGGLLAATGPIGSLLSAGKDVIPALLAKGEEVIRTSSAMFFRPLLKDINDNAGKLWQSFSNATVKQNLNNTIQSDLNKKFNDLIKQFKELVDGETQRIRTNNRRPARPPGGGPVSGGPVINIQKPNNVETSSQNVSNISAKKSEVIQNIANSYPTNIINNVIAPQLNAGKNNIIVVPLKVRDLRRSKQQPKVNVINLPPKTVNLGPKPGSVKTPSSGSATEVPSISPFDSSNPYISSNRLAYGMIM